MPATKLDHINIRTTQPEATRDFFVDVVGLRDGERPPFNFGGYWLYAGEQAVIHLTDARDSGARHGRRARRRRYRSRIVPDDRLCCAALSLERTQDPLRVTRRTAQWRRANLRRRSKRRDRRANVSRI